MKICNILRYPNNMVRIPFFLVVTFSLFMSISVFAQNQGSQFEYSQDDIPEICFFPTEKARWDGYKITNKNWNQLTDFQKMSFVSEAILEIELNANAQILLNNEERLLSVAAVNAAVEKAEVDNMDLEFLIIKLLHDSFKDAERIKLKETENGERTRSLMGDTSRSLWHG